jgi:hypothetical protein
LERGEFNRHHHHQRIMPDFEVPERPAGATG